MEWNSKDDLKKGDNTSGKQKDKVRSLMSFTGVRYRRPSHTALVHFATQLIASSCSVCPAPCGSESRAIDLLSQSGWQLDAAADRFFMSGGAPQPSVDAAKVGALFDQYKGAHAPERSPSPWMLPCA